MNLGELYWEIQRKLLNKQVFTKNDKLLPISLQYTDKLHIYSENLTQDQIEQIEQILKSKGIGNYEIHNTVTTQTEDKLEKTIQKLNEILEKLEKIEQK